MPNLDTYNNNTPHPLFIFVNCENYYNYNEWMNYCFQSSVHNQNRSFVQCITGKGISPVHLYEGCCYYSSS